MKRRRKGGEGVEKKRKAVSKAVFGCHSTKARVANGRGRTIAQGHNICFAWEKVLGSIPIISRAEGDP